MISEFYMEDDDFSLDKNNSLEKGSGKQVTYQKYNN